jgi:hypothetical protein
VITRETYKQVRMPFSGAFAAHLNLDAIQIEEDLDELVEIEWRKTNGLHELLP